MKQTDIVCITMTTWEGDYMKTIVHMMKQLSKNHRVLFVDYPFTYKDLAFSMIGKSTAPAKRMIGIHDRLRKLDKNLYHLTLPPVLPVNWINDIDTFKTVLEIQSKPIELSIKKAMNKIGMSNPLVINAFNPLVGLPLVGKLNESKIIYYCYDEIRAAQWCGKHGGEMEDLFIQKADAVITTSSNLYAEKKKKNPNTLLVRNGVDFALFNKAADPLRFQKPVKTIGYVGSVDFRLDYDLLEKIITQHHTYQFSFVGRITDQVGYQRLIKYKNVSFSGALQPADIPQAMAKFDLGLIPFSKNEFTKNVYPLKINEYLGAGIPVVTTDFADLSDFENHVSIAPSDQAFTDAIVDEILNDDWEKSLERMDIARNNDWSSRAAEVEKIIDQLYLLSHA